MRMMGITFAVIAIATSKAATEDLIWFNINIGTFFAILFLTEIQTMSGFFVSWLSLIRQKKQLKKEGLKNKKESCKLKTRRQWRQ